MPSGERAFDFFRLRVLKSNSTKMYDNVYDKLRYFISI